MISNDKALPLQSNKLNSMLMEIISMFIIMVRVCQEQWTRPYCLYEQSRRIF